MKTPRTTDFDPNAKLLKSSMDNFPAIETPQQRSVTSNIPRTPVPPYPVRYSSPPDPNGVPRPVPLQKRKMKQRQPFDIYEDQYEKLKKIADDERYQGLPGSMSRMVRDGIDMYLHSRETANDPERVEE